MMIKKRLTISNILMLIIPLILISIIAGIMRIPFSKLYEEKFNQLRENDNMAYHIQDMLRIDMQNINSKDDLNVMSKKLKNFLEPKGYHLIIISNKEVIFSNLTEIDENIISSMGNDLLFQAKSFVVEMNSTSLVKNSFKENNKIINMIAVNSSYEPKMIDVRDDMKNFMIMYVGIVCIIAVIIITITNAILSSKVSKSLIVPLQLLSYGAEQIKEGNLDFDMTYESNDEFGRVCSEFDEMRIRLKESIEKQLKYEENRKELIVGISHDLRTPLTVIKGYVQGLLDGVAKTPEKQKKYLDTIYTKTGDINSLVESLFIFSKLDTGSFPFNFQKVSINNYVENLYNSVKEEFLGKGLKIDFKNNCKPIDKVKLDCKEMDRVFFNILENSVKYKSDDTGLVKLKLYKNENYVVIEIADNGKGVSDKELSNLFLSFYRADSSRTNPSEGSGLGLSIAKHIIEAHGGKIMAESRNGLTIKIILPLINEI